jgi:hypothetical protein
MINPSASRAEEEEKNHQGSRKKWIDLLNESVHTSDDIDIGDIIAVSRATKSLNTSVISF